jgi:hypothetical protein
MLQFAYLASGEGIKGIPALRCSKGLVEKWKNDAHMVVSGEKQFPGLEGNMINVISGVCKMT